MVTSTEQLQAHRDWQTLASYVKDLGGNVNPANPRLIEQQVCSYFSGIIYVELQPQEVLENYLATAKKYVQAKFTITNWKHYLNAFKGCVDTLSIFSGVSQEHRKSFVSALTNMATRMTVQIGGRTENNGGDISVARSVISEGEDTALFALFHELGHGVQTEGDIPTEVKNAIYASTSESGARFGELFADAFAALALKATGWQVNKILGGATGALANHGSDADHPDWPTRRSNINAALNR